MTSPMVRSEGNVVGCASRTAAYDPNPGTVPTASRPVPSIPASSAEAVATSPKSSWATKTLAPESLRM